MFFFFTAVGGIKVSATTRKRLVELTTPKNSEGCEFSEYFRIPVLGCNLPSRTPFTKWFGVAKFVSKLQFMTN